jgi:hypothetical protein
MSKHSVTKTEKGWLISGLSDDEALYLLGILRAAPNKPELCLLSTEATNPDEFVYFCLEQLEKAATRYIPKESWLNRGDKSR